MLNALPAMPVIAFKLGFFVCFLGAAVLAFWSMKIANDALRKGEVKSRSGLPDKMFGMPTNEIIWRALRKRAAEGNREAILLRRIQWVGLALAVIFFLWPKAI